MKKQILLAFFFSFTYLGLNAQCNIPFPPSLDCASAPVICDLDGYCTTTGGGNATDQPSTFCGSVQNNQWFAFVAGSANITLDFIVGSCGGTGSGTGLQAQVYSVCGAPWTSASNCLYEISPNSTETLTMNNLTVGNVYYLMTDGFSGDMCDYTIEVTSGSTTPPVPDPAGAISGDATFCPGASSVTYCAAASSNAAFYQWTIPSGATIVGADDGACITIDFSGYTGGIGSSGTITATPTNGCEFGDPSSFTVTQGPSPTGPDQNFILCPGETATYGNTVYSTATNGTPFVNTDIANAQGCLIETLVYIEIGQNETTDLVEVICQGEASSTGETSSGNYTYNLLTNYYECDSTVTLNLTVLDPQTGIFPVTDEIDCSFTPITVSAVVTNTDPTISYVWSGPCFTQNFPQDPDISVSCGGVYSVYAEQTFGGVTCVSPSFSVTVTENTTPPTADPGLGGVINCATGCVTLGGGGSSNSSTYAYSWVGPNGYSESEQFPQVCEPGTYCFFMIDLVTSCISSTECVTVTGDNTPPVAVANASNNLDCNSTTATLSPTGSDPGIYTWSGQVGSNPTVSSPGTYTLTVTSSNGCTATQEVTITQDASTPTANIAAPSAIDCNNTTVSLDGSGSSSGVTYLWSTGETTSTATTNMGAGTYTLTVTNTSNGCTDEVSVVVDDNSTTVTAEVDVQGQITCTNGSVTLTAINVVGSSNPSYSWSNGTNGQTTTVNSAGAVTLTVTDINTGCTVDVTADVTSDTNAPTAVAGVSGQLDCNNTSVVLSTAGSSTGGNITASWSTANPNNVTTSGTYTLTITNTDNGCTATADVEVIQDVTPPVAAIAAPTAIDCNNTNTTLDGSSSTGTNLTYAWTGPATGSGATLNATDAGTYTLTVTNMDNGCTDTEEVIVVDNTTTVLVTASVSNELTCVQNSATLDVSSNSGSSNPTYTWTGPESGTGTTLNVSTSGTYTLTLIDANTGCQGSTTVTVLEDVSGPTASVAPANDLTCTTTSITLDGTASSTGNNITYQWFNGATAVSPGNTAIIDVTVPGDYTLVVTDNDNGCTTTSTVVLVILDNAAPSASAVAGNNGVLSCTSSSLTLDGSSSTGNCLTYEWTNNGSVVGTAETLNVSNAGDYILVVTNCDNGCTDQTTINVAADSGLPNVGIEPVVNLDCNNSTSTLQGTGSSNTGGTISVEWFYEGTTLNVTDPNYTTMLPGEYTFVVTDEGNGCSSSATVQLSENTVSPNIDIATAPIIDCANTTVTINATNSASGANISYQWQDGTGVNLPGNETANTLMTSTAGDYILVVTNSANGCTSTQMVTVPENIEAPVFDATALNNIDCNNMEASLESNVTSSFSTDLTYQWILNGTNVGDQPSLSTSNDGDFILIITDTQNGCTSQVDVTVLNTTQDPTISATASSNGALDCITTETTLDGTGSDTGANFNYEWTLDTDPTNVLSTDIMYSTMDPGTYILTVTNTDNGCVSTTPLTITQSITPPTAVAGASNNTLTCTSPEVTLDGSGSSIGANFSYQWFDVTTLPATPTVDQISYNVGVAGTYELVVTNTDNGCTAVSAQVVIEQSSDVPTAVISNDGILTCDNGDVLLDGFSSTAGGTLTYEWIDSLGNTIDVGPELTVTTSGEITLFITDTNNGCTSTDVFFVDEDVEAPAISVNPGATITCAQPEYDLDGSASTLDPNITYTYAWTAANDPSYLETTLTVPNVGTPDTYTLLITNTETGCTASEQVIIDGDFDAPSVMTSNDFTITCSDNTAPLMGTGSSTNGNFTYEWMQGNTLFSTQLDTVTTQTGSYTLIVTNEDNGCSSISNEIVIDIDADLPAVVVAPASTITCDNNGEIILDGSASETGTDIEYQWFLDGVEVAGGTNAFLTATLPGDYTFQVNNIATGCSDQVSFTVDADQTPPVAEAGSGGTLICGQASYQLDAVAAGSSDGTNFTYTWFDASGNQVGTGPVFDATAPGNFVVDVLNTDNGCSTTSNVTAVVADSNSPVLLMDPSADGLTCDIQTITYDASASTVNPNSSGTLIYQWTDASGAPLGNTPTIDVDNTDPVTLTITDDVNNCSVSATYVAPQDVEQPTANAGSAQTLFCGTTDVTLDGSGSNANGATFTYTWTDPNNDPAGNTATIDATIPGTYTLLITNTDNGCTSTSTVEVDQDINVPTAAVDFAGMITCNVNEISVDGSASSTTSGGGLEYEWTGGATSPTATFDAPGTYTLTITDVLNNCTATQSFTIEEDVLPPVADIQALTSSTISCTEPTLVFTGSASNNNGNPNGGTLTYEWFLDNILVSTATPDQVEISEPGDLELVVTNTNNGCTSTFLLAVDISNDVPLANVPTTPQPLTCAVDEVTIVATGSTGSEYTYQWTGPGTIINETSLTPTVSATGTYTLTVTNTISGCDISITTQVDGDFNAPNAFANATDQFDCVTDEVTLDGTGSATGPNISYAWSTSTGVIESGATSFNPVVSAPGDYTLLVTDSGNGCTAAAVVTVSANTDVPTIAGVQVIDPNCFGENNGSITLDNVVGGQLPYLYSIDGGALAPVNQFSFLSAGEYDIVVQDANGCETNQVVTITDPQELLVELGDNQIIGLGDDFQLSAQIVGAYDTIIWSANCPDSICADQPEFSISPLNTVSYNVTVIDGNGCITTDQITINVEKGREVFIPNAFTPNGDGNNDRFWIYPGGEVAKVHEFRVFNRWGEQVFGVSNYDPFVQDNTNGWDGTLNNKTMNPGVFVYYVDIEFIDGRREVLKGDVALRR